jgi:hypothetical protein
MLCCSKILVLIAVYARGHVIEQIKRSGQYLMILVARFTFIYL